VVDMAIERPEKLREIQEVFDFSDTQLAAFLCQTRPKTVDIIVKDFTKILYIQKSLDLSVAQLAVLLSSRFARNLDENLCIAIKNTDGLDNARKSMGAQPYQMVKFLQIANPAVVEAVLDTSRTKSICSAMGTRLGDLWSTGFKFEWRPDSIHVLLSNIPAGEFSRVMSEWNHAGGGQKEEDDATDKTAPIPNGEAKAEVIPATHANEAANLSAEPAGVADPEASPETADKTTEPATEAAMPATDPSNTKVTKSRQSKRKAPGHEKGYCAVE